MKRINVYQPNDPEYASVCSFAQRIYTDKLSINISHFPDLLFTIREDSRIVGCMGLNTSLTFDLFLNDKRVQSARAAYEPWVNIGEQSVFAIENFSMGVPLLISVVAEYARIIGIHKIIYAAIGVSRRTIERLGFTVAEYGLVDMNALCSSDRGNYERWYETHSPLLCVLDTANTMCISENILFQFSNRARLDGKLAQHIHLGRAHLSERAVA